uniref:Uncharacterized protein n=1 Tax=Physcomitrium patens TaxID=3218 RepID=A0A2K1J599_PHYPA|nr:hypothetical protein PHYPA_022552 [Physcomitrium patens]
MGVISIKDFFPITTQRGYSYINSCTSLGVQFKIDLSCLCKTEGRVRRSNGN